MHSIYVYVTKVLCDVKITDKVLNSQEIKSVVGIFMLTGVETS